MKKMNLRLLALCCTLGITNQVFAASDTFLAPPSPLTLISENGDSSSTPDSSLYPGSATSSLHISIPYTTTGTVASAILNVCLADDLSSNFAGAIDSPMEDAIVANITGTGSIADTSFPVQLNLFTSPPATPIQVTTATNAGIENPSLIPAPNAPCINYPVDVSSVILSNGSGTLSFDLEVSAMYPDLFSPSAAWNMIVAAATVFDPNYIPEDPYLVQED